MKGKGKGRARKGLSRRRRRNIPRAWATVAVSMRLPADVVADFQAIALDQGISFNRAVCAFVLESLER